MHGIADARVGDFLDRRGEEPDFARPKPIDGFLLRSKNADAIDLVAAVRRHHLDALALLQVAVDNANEHDDAEISVIPTVDEHGLQRL